MNRKYPVLMLSMLAVCLTGCGSGSSDYSKYVTLGDYKNLSATLSVEKVTDQEVDEYEKEQLEEYVSYEEVNGPVKEGQLVQISLLAKDGEEVVYEFAEDEEYELVVGQEDFGSEVDDRLIGGQVGDELDFSVTYDDDFADAYLCGKQISYHIEIQKISDVIYPELTNEFVEENFAEQSVEAWRKTLAEELHSTHQADATDQLRDDLVQQVVDGSKISGYPKELYKQTREMIVADYQNYADMFGCSLDEVYEMFEVDEKTREQEYIDETNRTMVLDLIRKQENITLSDEQLQEKMEELVQEEGYSSVDELLENNTKESLEDYFLRQMTVDFLEEHAEITIQDSN